MSLLMQALKKAEHAKQKQGADEAPPENSAQKTLDDTLSLSPKDADAAPTAKPEPAGDPTNSLNDPLSALTLTPHAEEKQVESPAIEPLLAPLPVAPPELPRQDINVRLQDDAPAVAPNGTEKSGTDKASPNRANIEHAEIPAKNPVRPNPLKIGNEQKLAEALAEKNNSTARQKAQSVFASKKMPQRTRLNVLIGVITLIFVAAAAGVGYFYWQSINAFPSMASIPAPLPAPAVPAANPEPAAKVPDASANPQATAGVGPSAPASATATAALPAAPATPQQATAQGAPLATSATGNPSNSIPSAATATPPAGTAGAAPSQVDTLKTPERTLAGNAASTDTMTAGKPSVAAPRRTAVTQIAQAAESSAIQIRQTSSENRINPALSNAYQSFISGDTASAKQQYQKVLQQEPANRDALLGMAVIALNQRQPEQAGSFYGKLLELDPADPEANAGLTSLQQGDPIQSEGRLKKILSQNPQAGAVLFALGNLYAQQSRWSDAQQIYFRAYTTAPVNADYAFNLAVSLDRLNQTKLAKEYYQRALVLGQSGPGNFSRSGVKKRISELEAPVDD